MEDLTCPNADCGKLRGKQNDLGANAVNHPSHYTTGDIECIDAIRSMLGDEFVAYCRGTIVAYIWRAPHKQSEIEDLHKALTYLGWGIDAIEKRERKDESSPLFEAAQATVGDVISACTDDLDSYMPNSLKIADTGRIFGIGDVAFFANKGCMKTGGDGVA